MSRFDRSLSGVLRAMANAEMLVTDEQDRVVLRKAAGVIEENFDLEKQPRVMITGGYLTDPIVDQVQGMVDDVDELRDVLGSLGDNIEGLVRDLKKMVKSEQ